MIFLGIFAVLLIALSIGALLYYCRNIFDKDDKMDDISDIEKAKQNEAALVLDIVKPDPKSSTLTAKVPREIIKYIVTDVIKTIPTAITTEIVKNVPQHIIDKAIPSCKKYEETTQHINDEEIDLDDETKYDATKCNRNKRKIRDADFTAKTYGYIPDIILQD